MFGFLLKRSNLMDFEEFKRGWGRMQNGRIIKGRIPKGRTNRAIFLMRICQDSVGLEVQGIYSLSFSSIDQNPSGFSDF